jgi:hypothetical protein
MKTSTKVLLIIGGIALAAMALFIISSNQRKVLEHSKEQLPSQNETVATTTEASTTRQLQHSDVPPVEVKTNPSTITKTQVTQSPMNNDSSMDALIADYRTLISEMTPLMSKASTGVLLTADEGTKMEEFQNRMDSLNKQLDEKNTKGVTAGIQVNSHGYEITVKFNGQTAVSATDATVVKPIYNKEHYSYQLAVGDIKETSYPLVMGKNSITITYKKIKDSTLTSDITLYSYPSMSEFISEKITGESGVLEGSFELQHNQTTDLQKITLSRK